MHPRRAVSSKLFRTASLPAILLLILPYATPSGPRRVSAVKRAQQSPQAQAQPAQAPQSIGSISSTESVSINGAPAPPDATIFPGDTVSTGANGTATVSISGKGAIKLASNSEISFAPDPRYTGELKAGTAVLNSFGGATDISVRAGTYVVAPVIQSQQSASKIERQTDGSFTISCLDGSVGLIPLEGATGRVLQSGQAVKLLVSGQLEAAVPGEATPGTPTETTPPATPPVQAKSKKNEYIILGLAGPGPVGTP